MDKYTININRSGYIWRSLNGSWHCDDGPAIEWVQSKIWIIHGLCHREDGPAVEWADGRREWYLNDERHRIDGPAMEWPCGFKAWYLNGEEYFEDEHKREVADR